MFTLLHKWLKGRGEKLNSCRFVVRVKPGSHMPPVLPGILFPHMRTYAAATKIMAGLHHRHAYEVDLSSTSQEFRLVSFFGAPAMKKYFMRMQSAIFSLRVSRKSSQVGRRHVRTSLSRGSKFLCPLQHALFYFACHFIPLLFIFFCF